jgi:hypothetical protein
LWAWQLGEANMDDLPQARLTEWAESCLRINHLNTLVQREIDAGALSRAKELSERARQRAWTMFNEMLVAGATKPEGYAEPDPIGPAQGE